MKLKDQQNVIILSFANGLMIVGGDIAHFEKFRGVNGLEKMNARVAGYSVLTKNDMKKKEVRNSE